MKNLLPNPLPLVLTLPCLLTSCLDNEEVIEVHPDGSVTVTLASQGDVGDLVTGYAVPLGHGFAPADAETERWLRVLGPDTGGPLVQARYREVGAGAVDTDGEDGIRLSVTGTFPSVADLPRWYAAAEEPYATAYLERTARLSIEDKGDRVVYVFERTFHGRTFARYDLLDDIDEDLSEPLREKLQELEPLSAAELTQLGDEVRRRSSEEAEHQVRDAFELAFVEASVAPPPGALAATIEDVRRGATQHLSDARLGRLLDDMRAWDVLPEDTRGPHPLEAFEAEGRDAFRACVEGSLVDQRVAEPARHAVMYGLEWVFTAWDHTTDLGDEDFDVRVSLPGTIVGGNHTELADGFARWTFSGEDLHDADRVLRVVSVLGK